jgi:3-oxoacyl-[acyl-carrier-protein] synthase-3
MAEQGNGLSIKAAVAWFPPDREGPSSGELSAEDAERIGVTELTVSQLAAPEMAVLAARDALKESGVEPDGIGYLVHSYLYHQGFDIWSPAHYIAHQAGTAGSLPVNVQQTCNGGALALHLAATWMTATPDASAALVTAADRFAGPGFDRWTSDEARRGQRRARPARARDGGRSVVRDPTAR